MRHLYAAHKNAGPEARAGMAEAVERAKQLERRRCGHHPESFAEPLSTAACLAAVVGPTNRHRYVVATQDLELRRALRNVPGVPLVYVNRSVVIMEPMAAASADMLQRDERSKFRAGIRPALPGLGKRKREEDEVEEKKKKKKEVVEVEKEEEEGSGSDAESEVSVGANADGATEAALEKKLVGATGGSSNKEKLKKKKRRYGPAKGPNPLSVKKSKKRLPKEK